MSGEGQRGHGENSIVLIMAMTDRLCCETFGGGERVKKGKGWHVGKAELRNGEEKCEKKKNGSLAYECRADEMEHDKREREED